VILLAGTLAIRGHFRLSAAQWRGQLAIFVIALIMGIALYLLAERGAAHLASGVPLWRQAGVLASLVMFGTATYFTLIHVSGTQNLTQLARRLRRRG